MSELTLVYSEMEDAVDKAVKVAEKCQDYIDELERKWTNKWGTIPGTPLSVGNSRMESANYYVEKKKQVLKEKKNDYANFATNMSNLIEDAKAADNRVAKTVNSSQKIFLKEHKNFSGDGWAAFFAAISVNVPLIGWIVDAANSTREVFNDISNNIRHWYEVGGGKKVIDTILVVGEIVLGVCALVVAVLAFPVNGVLAAIAAVAGVIVAVIALVDGCVNFQYQLKANKESDPAWAKYYGDINSFSDHLRKKTFKSKWLNQNSNTIANVIEIVDLVCSIIDISSSIGALFKRSGLKKIFSKKITFTDANGKVKYKYKFSFTKFKGAITTSAGRASIKKTLKVSWKGMVFGDDGGITGWKKRWIRAFKSKPTYGKDVSTFKKLLVRTEKIVKIFQSDFSKTMKIVKLGDVLNNLNNYPNKWKLEDSYDLTKDLYSFSNGGDIVGTITKPIDLRTKILKTMENLF